MFLLIPLLLSHSNAPYTDLHSNMFLLIHAANTNAATTLNTFTFQYVSINTNHARKSSGFC